MPPVAAIPTNQPKICNLPSKFIDRLNPLKQNVSAGFPFCFPLPHPALPQSARRAAVRSSFLLFDIFSCLRCSTPHRRSLPSCGTAGISAYTFVFCTEDSPCALPVCKRPGSVLAVCVIFSLLLDKQPAQRLSAAFARISALPCPAADSFGTSLLLPPFRIQRYIVHLIIRAVFVQS